MQFVSMSTRWSSPTENSEKINLLISNERGHLLLLQWLSFHMPLITSSFSAPSLTKKKRKWEYVGYKDIVHSKILYFSMIKKILP